MTITTPRFSVVCDGLDLTCGALVPDDARGVVVFLHGIPSVAPPDPDDRGYPGMAEDFADRGWAAAWVDMRGVRKSPGYFSIEGWVSDATATVEAARALDGAAGKPVVVVGSSAGGAVATEVVSRGAPVDALVLLAAPARWLSLEADPAVGVKRITQDAGMALAPEVLADPTAWAEEFHNVSPEGAIGQITIPLLIMHGTADDVVPVQHAHMLAARAPGATVDIIEGAPHQLRRVPGVFDRVLSWIEEAVA